MSRRRSNEGGVKYKIIDVDGSELSVDELLAKYFFSETHHTSCSVIFTEFHNNTIEHYSMVEDKQPQDEDKEDKKIEVLDNIEKEIDNITDDTATSKESDCCSSYRYTPQQIEDFFASDNGQEEGHSLEESICRPLIGQRSYKPYFYYCKEDPDVEFLQLKSMEDHIRLKDPQRHKAKLLEKIQNDQIDGYENKNNQDIIIKT